MNNEVNTPEGWSLNTLINIADYHNGAAFKPKDWSEEGLPIVRIEQLNNVDAETDKFNGILLPNNFIDTGDLIFSWSATLKVVIWNRGPAALNQHLYKVVPKPGIDRLLLLHILDFNMNRLAGQSQGSTMKHVTRRELSRFQVAYPKKEKVQKKIASILEAIDQAIEKTEALIEKYQQIKAGLMHDLFTRGIGADGKLRPPRDQAPELYQETSVGWLPKGWVVKPLGELCDIASGGTPSRGKSNFWGGSIPWIKTGEIKYNEIVETEEYITQEGLNSSSAKLFRKGTVVMAIYGEGNTRGRVAILGIDSTSNQACVGFSFGNQVQSQFMYFLFENSYSALRDMSNDGSQKNLSSSLLKQFNVAFPVNHNEQIQISNCLLALDKALEKERQKREKLRQQKSGLMHDLLTGKGKVQVNIEQTEATHV
jgi:type I restriction enzyme S subunit